MTHPAMPTRHLLAVGHATGHYHRGTGHVPAIPASPAADRAPELPPDPGAHLTAKGVPPNLIAEILARGCPPGRGWVETYVKKGHRYRRYSWRATGADGKAHKQHVHIGPVGTAV